MSDMRKLPLMILAICFLDATTASAQYVNRTSPPIGQRGSDLYRGNNYGGTNIYAVRRARKAEAERQLKEAEQELIDQQYPDPKPLTKDEIETLIDEKVEERVTERLNPKKPEKEAAPPDDGFGKIGGLGQIGGIGGMGGLGNVDELKDLNKTDGNGDEAP